MGFGDCKNTLQKEEGTEDDFAQTFDYHLKKMYANHQQRQPNIDLLR